MIKYLGSKRRLVAQIGELAAASGASTALDLFTGTTRVAQELGSRGLHVTAVDSASYSEVLATCYVVADRAQVDADEVADALARLDGLPDVSGYVTETFCERSRYFQPMNGRRIDAIRAGIDDLYPDEPLRSILLTSLLEAADAVDSTVGLQMAYLKSWSPRSYRPLRLRPPVLTPGTGSAIRGDAHEVAAALPPVDLAYLDPPYNQHRYFTNYHVWETLVRWDAPAHYGVACKRLDSRDDATKSVFNTKRAMPAALDSLIQEVRAETLLVSFSNEGFVALEDLVDMCRRRGDAVEVLAYDSRRYIGSLLGGFNPSGDRVGAATHTRNTEYLVVGGEAARVAEMVRRVTELDTAAARGDRRSPLARPVRDLA